MYTILLVEDNEQVMKINRESLELRGFRTRCAASARQARDILEEEFPDLIVLDVMLPDGSGLDLCRKIRERSNVPILFLTCLGDSDQIVSGLEAGGDDYLTKPYRLKELTARIDALLRRSQTSILKQTAELGGPVIDPISQMILLKNSPPVQLSQKEFGLLMVLLENKDQYVSEKRLYRLVWGHEDNECDKNIIRVNISRLRKKLSGEEASKVEITYIQDKGYKLAILE